MDIVRALVSVHRFQVRHVAEHDVLVRDTVAAVHVACSARDLQRLAAVVPLDERDHLGGGAAFVHEAPDAERGLQARGVEELSRLLAHADRRVRTEALRALGQGSEVARHATGEGHDPQKGEGGQAETAEHKFQISERAYHLLVDDVGFPTELEEWQKAGANYAMHLASEEKELKPVGEWNTTKIVVNGPHVEHWLNGKKILEFERWTDDWNELKNSGKWKDAPDYGDAKTGRIVIQDHGSVFWFRNIKIREIEDAPAEE